MDPHFKCARANWRPPIGLPSKRSWLFARIRRQQRSVHLFLFQRRLVCLLLLWPYLVASGSSGAEAELAPPATVEQITITGETYNLASPRRGSQHLHRGREESLLPASTNSKRTSESSLLLKTTKFETQEQLSPISFAAAAAAAASRVAEDDSQTDEVEKKALLLPLTSSSNVTAKRYKRSHHQQQQQKQPPTATASNNNSKQKHSRTKVIHAMLKGQTQLACNLDSSEPDDSVSLVLWYKDSSMVPIFSLDARSSPTVHEARHKPGQLLEGRSSLKLLLIDQDSSSSNLLGGSDAEPASGRSRRHTSERQRRKRPSRQSPVQPEGDDENHDDKPTSSALVARTAAAATTTTTTTTTITRGKQLWAKLQIDSLSSEDNGVYVCRVDFRRARSRVQELALRIIVPADTPIIRDLSSSSTSTSNSLAGRDKQTGPVGRAHVLGPYNEGSRVVLECETQGGYPEPSLSWWRDGRLVDDSYEIVSGQDGLVVSQVAGRLVGGALSDEAAADREEPPASSLLDEGDTQTTQTKTTSTTMSATTGSRLFRNRLELGPLARSDLLANYSCKAPNGKLQSDPPSSFVMIDMNLRPVKVQIDNERLPVLADRPLEIVCRAFGSRPAALISWFRGPNSNTGDRLVPQHPPQLQLQLQLQQQQQQQQLQNQHQHQHLQPGFSAGQIKIEESIGSESNVTTSTLTIWPRPHDSGQIVTCRAENPYMSNMAPDSSEAANSAAAAASSASEVGWIDDSWKLEVHYLPRVQLQLGEKLQGQSIREGQDVYFECKIQAQPYVQEIRWWFNGKELEQSNLSQGLIVSNQSLVLQRVSRTQRGHYTCSAINSVGESHSSSLYLRVQFAPICRDHSTNSSITSIEVPSIAATSETMTETDLFLANSQQRFKSQYGAARMESVRVFCHVDADPADGLVYKWAFLPGQAGGSEPSATFNQLDKNKQHQQMVLLDPSAFAQEQELGPLVSVATYTPRSELDYGTLLCWAQNELGQQADPCAYRLVAAEPPDPVRNCRLLNASDSQLVVTCEPGYDGGVDQSFQMEVYDSRRRELVANVSSTGLKNPASIESVISTLSNNTIEQQQDQDDKEQEDSPSSAALSLIAGSAAAGRQPKQRHSSSSLHHHNLVANNNGIRQPSSALNGRLSQETLFITEPILNPSTHYLLSIYSQNSKGASKPVAFTATTANSTSSSSSSAATGARARFFSSSTSSSSSSSSSQLSDSSSHLLSDVLALSWNPFLLVCAISVALFVLFGSLTFAMMKYIDHTQQPSRNSDNPGSPGQGNHSQAIACELALKQSSCLSKSDEQSSSSSSGSCASTTNTSSNGGTQSRRARIITLTANTGSGNRTGLSNLKETTPSFNGQKQQQQRDKVSLLESGSSYLKMKLQQIGGGGRKSQLKQSNSDNFLNKMAPIESESTLGHFERAAFSSSSLQRPARKGQACVAHQQEQLQQQPLLLNYVQQQPGEPRIEQLLISGKQYFHQTAPKQTRHLQRTAGHLPVQPNQQQHLYAAGSQSSSSSSFQLMRQGIDQRQAGPLCGPHQQLIDGQAGENYCRHLQATGQQQDKMLPVDSQQQQPPATLHMAHLRLVEMATNGLASLGNADSDSANSTNQTTLPSLFSTFSHATTTNGSPSSGIAVAISTPTSCSNGTVTDPALHHHLQQQQQQQQQYCCGMNAGGFAAGGSNSTITSSIEPGQQQQHHNHQHLFEQLQEEGGNVISVSDCGLFGGGGDTGLLATGSNLSSSSTNTTSTAASNQQQQQHPHHNQHQAKISSQFDGAGDGGFEENTAQQYLTYSAIGLPQHHMICTDLNHQYSVYVDHDLQTVTGDLNNNNQPQQIYLLEDQQQQQQLPTSQVKSYPTKARVRVFSGGSVASAKLDRPSNNSNYLRLIQPGEVQQQDRNAKQQEDSQQHQQQQQQLHTDV